MSKPGLRGDLAVVGKAYFAAGVFPQAVDGDESLGEVGDASDALDHEPALLALGVGGDDGQITNARDSRRSILDARHGLSSGSAVYKVAFVRVDMSGATAVEDETQGSGARI